MLKFLYDIFTEKLGDRALLIPRTSIKVILEISGENYGICISAFKQVCYEVDRRTLGLFPSFSLPLFSQHPFLFPIPKLPMKP